MEVQCPYCGESISVLPDLGGLTSQHYVEDCPVCCRPMELHVARQDDGEFTVEARREDE